MQPHVLEHPLHDVNALLGGRAWDNPLPGSQLIDEEFALLRSVRAPYVLVEVRVRRLSDWRCAPAVETKGEHALRLY